MRKCGQSARVIPYLDMCLITLLDGPLKVDRAPHVFPPISPISCDASYILNEVSDLSLLLDDTSKRIHWYIYRILLKDGKAVSTVKDISIILLVLVVSYSSYCPINTQLLNK